MKKLSILFLMICFSAACMTAYSQSLGYDDCDQLQTVLDDAKGSFYKHEGEFVSDDGYEEVSVYDFTLWDNNGAYLKYFYYPGDALYVEFFYISTYDLNEAKAVHASLLQKVKDCLPGYYESRSELDLYLVYNSITDKRDADKGSTWVYPQVIVTVEETEDFYFVAIAVEAPYE